MMGPIDYRPDGPIGRITINRPDRLGALSRSMVAELGTLLRTIRGDEAIRVVVITGTGRSFIAGADLEEYADSSPAEFDAYQRLSRATFGELADLPQPTIAAVNGFALGGGFEVALCCDFIIASDKARFGLPEVKLGLIPGGGGTQRLTRAVGRQLAKELIMTGEMLGAEDAERAGLLTRRVAVEDLATTVTEFAQQLSDNAPLAVRAAKGLIDAAPATELAAGLTAELGELSRLFGTRDAQEGIGAFLAKRPATFHGR
ncbi:enoyl-CoA hydratase/isomerase family protein [Microlunatus soli]|uniref:enoyl-CoA hydratase n=1 Tax=Microlunatus soli TaxID=630515 RepID=A0A1H1U1C9_9ACTN|nr:enoyl-CoA hydratase/isomerase family protein [Microlunatus soli]SDS66300.1 enoyl-CoA hydratase [Microlunatus soli]